MEKINEIWPEWKLDEKPLGKGSYGMVYKAVRNDHNVESLAAIKVISIPMSPSEIDSLLSEGMNMDATRTYLQGIVDDFVGEIQLMESLKGIQNIVSVEDYKVIEKEDEVGWDIYIRMELLTSFNSYISNKKMTEEEVIKFGCDICSALEICDKKNIIHRDIKPENIFVNEFGHFKLGDWGIARKMENMTGGLSQKGTYSYMAPEVARGEDYDRRVDIYSLGLVLYRLLNGNRMPFIENDQQLMNPLERKKANERRLKGEQLPKPTEASDKMANLILRACAFDPEQRIPTAAEMKQDLLSILNGTYQITEMFREDKTAILFRKESVSGDDFVQRDSVTRDTVKNNTKAPSKKKSRLLMIGLLTPLLALVLVVTLVIGGVVFSLKQNGNKKDTTPELNAPETSVDTSTDNEDIAYVEELVVTVEGLISVEDYAGALELLSEGINKYPNASELLKKQEEIQLLYKEQVKNQTLSSVDELMAKEDYEGALELLEKAMKLEDDSDNKNDYETYYTECSSKLVEKALAQAKAKDKDDDMLGAVVIIKDALSKLEENDDLQQAYSDYEKKILNSVETRIQQLLKDGNYKQAKEEVEEATLYIDNKSVMKELLEKIEKSKPVSISTLEAINAEEWSWNAGNPADPFQNDYTDCQNYAILDYKHYNYRDVGYIEYRLDTRYVRLTGNICPYESMSEEGSGYFQVFLDDVLAYTSPMISQKTDPFSFDIDISGADYIRIKYKVSEDSAIMLSDVMIQENIGYSMSDDIPESDKLEEQNGMSITKLKPFNSDEWDWNSGYPIDVAESDYTEAVNYAIFYSRDYHYEDYSVEYRLDEKFVNLNGTYAPHGAMGEESSGNVEIYLDDVLVFSSPDISRKTEVGCFDVNVSGGKYVKLVVSGNRYSSIMLSDVVIK